jgi:hypothetical protein
MIMGYLRLNQRLTPATAATVPGRGRSAEEIDMSDPNARCLGIEDGAACTDLATITQPVPLCTHHQMQVAVAIVPEMLASVLSMPKRTPVPEICDAASSRLVAKAKPVGLDLSGAHGDRVYFVRNGDRIKIGYTTNLRGRLGALCQRPDSVLLLLQGGNGLEAALHRYFSAHRIGSTEWFRYAGEIEKYIARKTDSVLSPATDGDTHESLTSRDALLAAIRKRMGSNRTVLLSDVVDTLQDEGAPADLTVTDLRRACVTHQVPVRTRVRAGERVSVGVHRDDVPA